MKVLFVVCVFTGVFCTSSFAQENTQKDILSGFFTEAATSYKWNFEQTAPTMSSDLKFSDKIISVEFLQPDQQAIYGPDTWAFSITNNGASNIEINWDGSYLTSFKGVQRKIHHGDLSSVSSSSTKNTVLAAKSKIQEEVVPREGVRTTHHPAKYNEKGEWVNAWNQIEGFQVFYGDDFPAESSYESLKTACEGKTFSLNLALVANGANKNYTFSFKVKSIDKNVSEDNPFMDAMNGKTDTKNTNGEGVKSAESINVKFPLGTSVKANWKNQGIFYPGKIGEIKDDQYYILYDDGGKEWTTADKIKLN
jgi:hypothetical protein